MAVVVTNLNYLSSSIMKDKTLLKNKKKLTD